MAKKPAIVPRKPSRVDRDKFVAGGVAETQADATEPKRADLEEPKRPSAQETSRSRAQAAKQASTQPKGEGRLVFVRADGREIKKVSIYFGKDTAKQLAVYCAHAERDMSAVVNELVAAHLPKVG